MTAIAGVWRLDGRRDADELCARALAAQRLYGPDDDAQWSDGSVAVGRRLFRLVPEDNFDRQPLIGGGGRYVLVADVRIDNRGDLERELRIPASQARTLSDAAVLLAAFERWREDCVEHVLGDYAFAVWDAADRQMLLARDPTGQRPLHFHRQNGLFAFASMPKGLHAIPEVPYAPDAGKIAERLLLMAENDTRSFFLGVERVPPGHLAIVSESKVTLRRHWQPKRNQIRLRSPDEYAEALRAHLDDAVRSRLRGTGDIGTFLSGGLDSGAVTATAARLLASTERRVVALTGVPRKSYDGEGPPGTVSDESPFAAATASLYPNIDHVIVPNEDYSPVADLDRIFYFYDRPANGLIDFGMARAFRRVLNQRGVKVILGGDMGNMGLSYDGLELLSELLSRGRWSHFIREARALAVARGMRRRSVMRLALGPWCPAPLWLWLHRATNRPVDVPEVYSAINPRRLAELDRPGVRTHDLIYRPWKDGFAMRFWALNRIDVGNFRKGALAMTGIEHRDPTSDVRLLNFCFGVPTEQFLRNGVPRALALRALADRLPKIVLEERRRGFQDPDWHENLTAWHSDLAAELDRVAESPLASDLLDVPRLQKLMADWPTGNWNERRARDIYRYALPRAVAIGHFVRKATGGNR